MKTTHLISAFLLVFLGTGCTHIATSNRENKFKNKVFVHLFFNSEQECIDSQPEPDFWYNCHQQLDFLEENKVQIMLTDIIWQGTYKIQKDLVILSFEPNYEIPSGEIIFEIVNSSKLINTENNTIWKKVSGNSIWN